MDDEEIWKTIREPVTKFTKSIEAMKLNVDKLIKFYLDHARNSAGPQMSGNDDKCQKLSPLALAKLELYVVYAINACYWLCLVTHGEDPRISEVTKTIERIRLFMNRAKEVEDSIHATNNSAKRPKIDKEASKRLCMSNITVLKSNWD